MAVIKGAGVVWGVSGLAFTAGIVSTTNESAAQALTVSRSASKFDLPDGDGEDLAHVFYNAKKNTRITVVPKGSSVSAAETSLAAYLPAPGTLITTTDSQGNAADDYNCITATENRTPDGAASIDLELEVSEANSPTAVIS